MEGESRHATNSQAGTRPSRIAPRWRQRGAWARTSPRDKRRILIVVLAVVLLAGLPAVALVAGLHSARAATSGVASAPGTPYVWGLNGDSELGTASTDTCSGYACSSTPLALSALPNVRAAAGGDLHSLVVTSDGNVYAWGNNSSGQLGVTTQQTCNGQPCSPIPVQVTGLPAIAAVAAGSDQSLALTSTGAVYAWGGNSAGELGIGSTTSTASPTLITGLPSNVIAIAADGENSLALTSTGAVYAWGDNTYGQIGMTTPSCGPSPCSTTPVQVLGLPGVTAIAQGRDYTLVLASTGTVYAWGDNSYGTLGNGSTTNSTTPVPVAQLANVTSIAAGDFSLALTTSGTVYAWGENIYGEAGASSGQTCGNGYPCNPTPVQMAGLPAGATAIAAGDEFALALGGDGAVWAWGTNTIGQLGNGGSDTAAHPTPAQVTGLSAVGAIATGGDHSIAIVPPAGSPSPTPTSTPPTAPVATLSTTFINFGTQQMGTTSAPSSVTLSNTGNAPLNVTGAALSGANAGDFVLAGGSCVSATAGTSVQLAPGSNCTMTISFKPTGTGTRNGTLTVSCDAADCPLSGSVTGNGINPSGSLSPSSVTFPDTNVGASTAAPYLIGVCNGGTTDLVITESGITGANPNDFTYSAPGPVPITVHPGDCVSYNTTFTPTAAGARSAALTFSTNDSLHTLSAALSGNGVTTPPPVVTADLALTLGASPNPVRAGSKLTYTITVTNNGTGTSSGVTLSDTLPANTTFSSVATTLGTCSAPAVGATGSVQCTVSSLANGASFTVTLVVTPTIRSGTLTDSASVTATTQDPIAANNTASVSTNVSKH